MKIKVIFDSEKDGKWFSLSRLILQDSDLLTLLTTDFRIVPKKVKYYPYLVKDDGEFYITEGVYRDIPHLTQEAGFQFNQIVRRIDTIPELIEEREE